MYYVIVNSKGIEARKSGKMLTIKQMQYLVGVEGQEAFFEVASYGSFSAPGVTIFCDDEFLHKGFEPTLVTKEGTVIHGQCLILGSSPQAEDFCLLSQSQVDIIKKEIQLIQSEV